MQNLTESQERVYKSWFENNCSESKTSKALDMSLSALKKHLYLIARKGLKINSEAFCDLAPAGWGNFMSTIQSNSAGELVQRWDRVKPIQENSEQLFNYLKTRIPVNKLKIKSPKKPDPKIQLEWTLADLHFGMLAWGKETGTDYDMEIARELLLDTASDIFARSGEVKETVLVLLGDNFHSDFYESKTEQSGNILDVDSRFPKMIKSGIDTYISAIETCLNYSGKVKVIVLYGNHDKQTSTILPYILWAYFRNDKRIEVDLSPEKAHYNYWGCTATMYHHGDNTKKQRLCSNFLLEIAKNRNDNPEFFYVKQGHFHHEVVEDVNGVIYETVPSPMAKDGFSAAAGYTAKRATVATAYHYDYGEQWRYSITPYALEMKRKNLK